VDITVASHEPVMVREVLDALQPGRGGVFVDCTLGLGGHTAALLEAGATRVIGIDRDASAIGVARERLAAWGDRVGYVHDDYRGIGAAVRADGRDRVDGVLADLGVSSMQLDAERGFSFRRDEPLDMRMDVREPVSAATFVAEADEVELARVIYEYGEERFSRRIARALVRARDEAPIETTGRLAAIVRRAIPHKGWQRIDPATRTFQAIRIHVNRELDRLDAFLVEAARLLAVGARMAVIAFHSLEDRIVKHTFRALAADESATWQLVTRRPLSPGDDECERNPRARSARLRVLERCA